MMWSLVRSRFFDLETLSPERFSHLEITSVDGRCDVASSYPNSDGRAPRCSLSFIITS